jgi:mannose/fructose/N-acetylgalactosamine-specific phosphotransferase system component IIB
MPVINTRIDQRLIHGQILTAWVPELNISEIIVVDLQTTSSDLIMKIMASSVPENITTVFLAPNQLAEYLETNNQNEFRSLILFKDICGMSDTLADPTIKINTINLANYVHHPDIKCIKIHDSFSVVEEELNQLILIANNGTYLYSQSLPSKSRVSINPANYLPA